MNITLNLKNLTDADRIIIRMILDVEFTHEVYGENIYGSEHCHIAWDEGNQLLHIFGEPIDESVPKSPLNSLTYPTLMNYLNEVISQT